MIRVVLLAPIHNSLYARLVAFALAKNNSVDFAGIVVRSHWNPNRIRAEFKRDGSRLIRKIFQKLIIGDHRYGPGQKNNLSSLAASMHLPFRSLRGLAKTYNIQYKLVPDHNQSANVNFIKALEPDLILFTGGGLIREPLLSIPKIGILNCHTGILPQYRGMDVVEWTALEEQIDSVGFGATLHFMDRGVDTGPILIKRCITPVPGSTFASIRAELETVMVKMMLKGVEGIANDSLRTCNQTADDGQQYFVMHPRMKQAAEKKLRKILLP